MHMKRIMNENIRDSVINILTLSRRISFQPRMCVYTQRKTQPLNTAFLSSRGLALAAVIVLRAVVDMHSAGNSPC